MVVGMGWCWLGQGGGGRALCGWMDPLLRGREIAWWWTWSNFDVLREYWIDWFFEDGAVWMFAAVAFYSPLRVPRDKVEAERFSVTRDGARKY